MIIKHQDIKTLETIENTDVPKSQKLNKVFENLGQNRPRLMKG